jgi:hypothetical protein
MIDGDAAHDIHGLIESSVEDDDQLERAGVMGFKMFGVAAQDRFDPRFLIVGGDQEQQTGRRLGHATDLPETGLFEKAQLGEEFRDEAGNPDRP